MEEAHKPASGILFLNCLWSMCDPVTTLLPVGPKQTADLARQLHSPAAPRSRMRCRSLCIRHFNGWAGQKIC